ncbi:MAG TPA: hypothetical protein VFI42_00665, partial [Thermomicrobiaceae bacterium]|nr:hypothetical protein [Thermomicrobiaceae bacterium]
MEIILWLVLGAVAGFLAVLVMYRTIPNTVLQWIGAIGVGLIGGWIGGWVTGVVGLEAVNWLGSLILAFVAAV